MELLPGDMPPKNIWINFSNCNLSYDICNEVAPIALQEVFLPKHARFIDIIREQLRITVYTSISHD